MRNFIVFFFCLGLCACSASKKTTISDGVKTTPPPLLVDSVLIVIDTLDGIMPTFQGGDHSKFQEWVSGNLEYPKEAMNDYVNGRSHTLEDKVLVTFVVNKQGWIVDVEILKSQHDAFGNSVKELLERSPKWTPGIEGEEPVNVRYTLPVHFNLNEEMRQWLRKERNKNRESPSNRNSEWPKW